MYRFFTTTVFMGCMALSFADNSATSTEPLRIVDKIMSSKVYNERPTTAVIDTIMLHFCSLVVLDPDKPYDIDKMIETFTSYSAAAHYLIDRDGTVYRLVPEKLAANHAGRGTLPFPNAHPGPLNPHSIGIEMFNISSKKDMLMFMSGEKYDAVVKAHPEFIGYTDAQYAALGELIKSIRSRHPAIKMDRYHVIGHQEYAPTRRTDPGELFNWTRIGLPATREANSPAAERSTSGTRIRESR